MKFFKKLFLLILIILIVILGSVYYSGYKLYKKTISAEPISAKIQSIKSDTSFTSIDDVPDYYKNAVVAVEDRRFYEHNAIDIISIGRAIVSNFKQKDLKEGGSTITQQTAKNMYFTTETDVVSRKIAEILVGIDLEKSYSKDEILEIYMNTIYFGDGYYGIKEACHGYLNKEPSDINISEATMLAGVPNAPSVYAPTKNIDLTQSRQQKVISSMVEAKYISQEEADSIDLFSFN